MPAKKTPSQLQREIDEKLAERYPYLAGKKGLWRHRAAETREQIAAEKKTRAHASRKRPRYVTLQWSDPTADPTQRFNEGSYSVDDLHELLGKLHRRGIITIATDDVTLVRKEAPEGMTVESLY